MNIVAGIRSNAPGGFSKNLANLAYPSQYVQELERRQELKKSLAEAALASYAIYGGLHSGQAAEPEGDSHSDQDAALTNSEDAATHDAAHQPETDDDGKVLQEEVALASDDEDARSDDDVSQQPATDDDQDASQDQVAIASDPHAAPTDDVDVMETANAEAAADPTSDDQAGSQPATSATGIPDDGFSFAAFVKPGVPLEVAKEAMPVEQPSPEESSSSGVRGSESVPEIGSEDVGNAAPSKEHVVHHGDLTP